MHAFEESDNTEVAVQDALDYEQVYGEMPDWQTLMILQEEQKRIGRFHSSAKEAV